MISTLSLHDALPISVMDLAQLVRPAGVIQDALGRSRLPGIDVRHDADVPNAFERRGSGHLVRSRWGTPLACWGTPVACPYPFSAKTRGDRDARSGRSRSAIIRVGAQHAAPLQPGMQDPLDQGPEVVGLSVYHR